MPHTTIKSLSSTVTAIAFCLIYSLFLTFLIPSAIAQTNPDDYLTSVQTDTRFAESPFSQELFWYIPWWDDACQYYDLPDYCSYIRQHQFADATLIMKADSTAYAQAILQLENPVSVAQAKQYGKTLSRGEMTLNQADEQTAERLLYDNTDPRLGAGSTLEMMLNDNGLVTEIIYSVSTP